MKLNLSFLAKISRLLTDIVVSVMFFEFIHGIFKTCDIRIYDVVIIALLVTASYLIREFSPNNIVMSILHIICGIILYFIYQETINRIILLLILFSVFCQSISFIKNDSKVRPVDDIPWYLFVMSIIMYFFAVYIGNITMVNVSYIGMIMIFVLFMATTYIDGLIKYVISSKDVSGLPLKRMISTNTIIVLGIVLLLGVFLAIADIVKLDQCIVNVIIILVHIIKYVFYLIMFLLELWAAYMNSGTEAYEQYKDEYVPYSSYYNNDMANMFEAIIAFVLIAIVLGAIIAIIKKLVNFFMNKRKLSMDVVEKISSSTVKKSFIKELIDKTKENLNNQEKIRRIYKNRILSFSEIYSPDAYKTTGDIKKSIEHFSEEDITNLTDIYESVRYGQKKADKELIKSMKKAALNKKKGNSSKIY